MGAEEKKERRKKSKGEKVQARKKEKYESVLKTQLT